MEIRNTMEYQLFRSLIWGLQKGSPVAARNLLEFLGGMLGKVCRYRRSLVINQLELSFPHLDRPQLEHICDGVYRHLGRTTGEAFGSGFNKLVDEVTVEPGWDHLDAALALGKGVIVATGHIGNFELGGAVLARRYSLLDVVKPQRNHLFDAHINNLRSERGILTVPMDQSGPVVTRHLRQGGVVSLLIDQDAGPDGVFVNFMGQPASTWPGVARLSLHLGCPVVPVAILRQKDNSHCMSIGKPIAMEARQSTPGGIREYLQDISNSLEGFVCQQPEQWFWVHRRWKSQMTGAENRGEGIGQEKTI